jgi:hypothetical protein
MNTVRQFHPLLFKGLLGFKFQSSTESTKPFLSFPRLYFLNFPTQTQKTHKCNHHQTSKSKGEHLPCAFWVNVNCVDRSKMTLHTAKLVAKHHMEELGFKLARCSRCGGDVHCFLSTSYKHVLFDRRDGSAVDRCGRSVCLKHNPLPCIPQLRSAVSRAGDQQSLLLVPLRISSSNSGHVRQEDTVNDSKEGEKQSIILVSSAVEGEGPMMW